MKTNLAVYVGMLFCSAAFLLSAPPPGASAQSGRAVPTPTPEAVAPEKLGDEKKSFVGEPGAAK